VRALDDPAYYAARYEETHHLRNYLADGLRRALPGSEIVGGAAANWLLCCLPTTGEGAMDAAALLCRRCRAHHLFLRDVGGLVRVAVKDRTTLDALLAILAAAAFPPQNGQSPV